MNVMETQSLFAEQPCWKLTPTDLVFLWEECRRCFYLKVVDGIQRPSSGFPKIFQIIDSKMRECFVGERTEFISNEIAGGLIKFGERWVESKPIVFPNHVTSCVIRGKLDAVIAFDNGTYGVLDFKTSRPSPAHSNIYFRQLNSYAYCLENAGKEKLALSPVTKLGLLVYEPQLFTNNGEGSASMPGSLTWVDIPYDKEAFIEFLQDVLSVLESPKAPESAPSCQWCQYRQNSRIAG